VSFQPNRTGKVKVAFAKRGAEKTADVLDVLIKRELFSCRSPARDSVFAAGWILAF
jgi:hypothetical protein